MASHIVFSANTIFLRKLLVFERKIRRAKEMNDTFPEIGKYFPKSLILTNFSSW